MSRTRDQISEAGQMIARPKRLRAKVKTLAVLFLVFVLMHVSVAAATGQSISGLGLLTLVLNAANTVIIGNNAGPATSDVKQAQSDDQSDVIDPPCARGRNPSPGAPRGRNEECRD
ncbi:MAG TPA: hypothetical protein VD966_10285 [Pyrinomonadaceae bacterium]|nr:hypothetical protein [Pyrinomonadaceae bacterium]